ncbi:MAG: alpha/beta hydrolase [Cyclobacteriaceae bacterium]|nr:alpha/beta hydrolase [Cyclobacteriaceae bacterium HetDA_MAG_MS6]
MNSVHINEKLGSVPILVDQSSAPKYIMVLAHGAGAPMHHPFMSQLAEGLGARDAMVIRFNFPYIEAGKKAPGSPKAATLCIQRVTTEFHELYPHLPIFLSGKSYGGRMSSHAILEHDLDFVNGLIYFGFPLHAPGRDSTERAAHLSSLKIPQLFLQGTKDKLANHQLITQVSTSLPKAELMTLDEGDHSFKVPKRTGKTSANVMEWLIESSNNWIVSKT